jgi:formate dehydrogenase
MIRRQTNLLAGSWLINTARGAIVVKEDVADALKSGQLRGYGGDVWFPQPAPKDHPLRYAQNPWGGGNAMVPHMSGTSIDAQKVRSISMSGVMVQIANKI